MAATVPASQFVSIVPSVISAGGTALDLNGLFLTTNSHFPVGQVLTFTTLQDVAAYVGVGTQTYAAAAAYFAGNDNSLTKPGAMLITYWPAAAVAGFFRGQNISALTLTQLQAINGTLSVVVDGVTKNGTANLSTATSFSSAAAIINTALGSGNTVTYDPIAGAFVITSATTGATSSVTAATGTAATVLGLNAGTVSPGSAKVAPGTFMNSVVAQTTNWASFTVLLEPIDADKIAFAAWTSSQNNRYLYLEQDADIAAISAGTSAGAQINALGYSGTALVYEPAASVTRSFIMGAIASIDFDAVNGRTNLAYRAQAGLAPTVRDTATKATLDAAGYNYYVAVGTANDQFNWLYPGSVTGPFDWLDSYVNQIWLNNALQLSLVELLTNVKSLPYNATGYNLIHNACLDAIQAAVSFGAIQPGITLSNAQIAEVNQGAGKKIDTVIAQQGWYLNIQPATPQTRAARGSPPVQLFYTDGGSINTINLASVEVQ
jgi:hypothetical protein